MQVMVQRSRGPILRDITGASSLKVLAQARMTGMEAWAWRGSSLRESIIWKALLVKEWKNHEIKHEDIIRQ